MMDATYTAEQLREDAHRADGIGTMADGDQLRAHADALEENARLRAELGKFSDRNGYALRQRAESAEAELAKLRQHAEAMANDLDRFAAQPDYDGQLYGPMPSIIAYRADFPEEK